VDTGAAPPDKASTPTTPLCSQAIIAQETIDQSIIGGGDVPPPPPP